MSGITWAIVGGGEVQVLESDNHAKHNLGLGKVEFRLLLGFTNCSKTLFFSLKNNGPSMVEGQSLHGSF